MKNIYLIVLSTADTYTDISMVMVEVLLFLREKR